MTDTPHESVANNQRGGNHQDWRETGGGKDRPRLIIVERSSEQTNLSSSIEKASRYPSQARSLWGICGLSQSTMIFENYLDSRKSSEPIYRRFWKIMRLSQSEDWCRFQCPFVGIGLPHIAGNILGLFGIVWNFQKFPARGGKAP